MKSRKVLIGVLVILLVLLFSLIVFAFLSADSKSDLSISDKQWIDKNKNTVVDISIINDIPVLSQNGEGLFFNFLSEFENETGISFNKLSHTIANSNPGSAEYVFTRSNIKDNDALLFKKDNYVVVSKSDAYYDDITEMGNITIGITSDIKEIVDIRMNYPNVTIVEYANYTELNNAYNEGFIAYILVPRLAFLDNILRNGYINYVNIDINDYYQLRLSETNKDLNSIFTKLYNTFMEEKFNDMYYASEFNEFAIDKNITDIEISSFKSKKYVYGYYNYAPYDNSSEFINTKIIEMFEKFGGFDIEFKAYNDMAKLNEDIEKGNIDIAYSGYVSKPGEYLKSVSVFNEEYVVLVNNTNNLTINNVNSIDTDKVYTLNTKNFKVFDERSSIEIVKSTTINKVLSKVDEFSVIILDKQVYNYNISKFNDYHIIYESNYNDMFYYVNKDDDLLITLFDYYLRGININETNNYIPNNIKAAVNTNFLANSNVLIASAVLIILIIIATGILIIKTRVKDVKMVKSIDKIKYMDQLTSLKNRAYLSNSLESWEKDKDYPQTVIVIDLNNIQYINDTHGHDEGDLVISHAANILINSQLDNSDIIRTDGNEFLIYLISYNEKQIVTYLKRIYRDFKMLPYGYGASLGYSMRDNDVKSIEDTINEATLSMRENKSHTKK